MVPVEAIAQIIEYLHEEKAHYENMRDNGEDVSNHIFNSMCAVEDWLNEDGTHAEAYEAAWAVIEKEYRDAAA